MSAPAPTPERPAPVCAWCETPFDEGRVRLQGRSVCPACGQATTDPWPTDAELDAAYGDWYRPGAGRFAGPGDRILRRTRGRLADRVDAQAPAGPVLDVGSGDGTLLDALRATGRETVGLERDSNRQDVVAEELTEHQGRYAAVVLWHSLEHLRRPAQALERAAALLVPGGLLVLAVPNAASLQARTFGDSWLALDLPRHLVHLDARVVLARLGELGLRVERVSYLRGGQVLFGWLHGLVGKALNGADLYDAIRRPEARARAMGAGRRAAVLAAAVALLPVAAAGTLAEVALRRGGTLYAEARRA